MTKHETQIDSNLRDGGGPYTVRCACGWKSASYDDLVPAFAAEDAHWDLMLTHSQPRDIA